MNRKKQTKIKDETEYLLSTNENKKAIEIALKQYAEGSDFFKYENRSFVEMKRDKNGLYRKK